MIHLIRHALRLAAAGVFVGTCLASPPPTQHTYTNINQMPGWENCDACAGRDGRGPRVPHSLTQHVTTPSVDGRSAKFNVGNGHPYTAALWWKQLGLQPNASHFSYDFYFYIQNPDAVQALEFDMNQSVAGHKFIFGHECSPRGSHQWDVWDGLHARWIPTGVSCTGLTPYHWHHVVFAAERVGTRTHFISVTLDGHTSYFNRFYTARPSGAHELNVAVQLDNNSRGVNYSLWADKINLNYW